MEGVLHMNQTNNIENNDVISNKIHFEMLGWEKACINEVKREVARRCQCSYLEISCDVIQPGFKSKSNPGYYFRGPNNSCVARIAWDLQTGLNTGLGFSKKAVTAELNKAAQKNLERARAKSVNKSPEQAKSREFDYEKGFEELKRFVTRNVREIVAVGAVAIMLTAGMVRMNNFINDLRNPAYANPSYVYGEDVAYSETHRTSDVNVVWYDPVDMAAKYKENMDFDSFVYGVFNNISWSRTDMMNELFNSLNARGHTNYKSFIAYCDDLGVCYEEDGKKRVDVDEYRKVIEARLIKYNQEQESIHKMSGVK